MLLGEVEPPVAGLGPGWVTTEMSFLKEAPLQAPPTHPNPRHVPRHLTAGTGTGVDIIAGNVQGINVFD